MPLDESAAERIGRLNKQAFAAKVAQLKSLAGRASSEEEAREVISRIAQISRAYRIQNGIGIPTTPIEQAVELDPRYRVRPHLNYISDRLANAVRDVERGQNRMLVVEMPPRAGKSTLVSYYSPFWMLRRHPEWKFMMTSYDGGLTHEWAKNIRTLIEERPDMGIALRKDGGAGGRWSTMEGGGMYATATGGSLTGRGARVFIIDDPVKDFVEAHSLRKRENLWNWWLSVAQTRLEQPYLVLVVMTRWHEDDFIGRILSKDHEGNPADWERIRLPAIAEDDNDAIGRMRGEPLLTPLHEETPAEAVTRWNRVREEVGSYVFAGLYQQRPAPQKGSIFDVGWWKFWTWVPDNATGDGRVVYVDPEQFQGTWIDSWDTAFKGGEGADWVVGQRWVRHQANRYLVHQVRGRWSFTETIAQMEKMALADSPFGQKVHQRLIEEAANGAAIIDTLKDKVSGMKPIRPKSSKESRARAITPEVESGNVYLPFPGDPGNGWVQDLLSELRNFPHDVHDDQVDALTQALSFLREVGRGTITVPGRGVGAGPAAARRFQNNRAAAARSIATRRL